MGEFDDLFDKQYEHLPLGRSPEEMKAADYAANLAAVKRACLRSLAEDVGGRQGDVTTFEVSYMGNTRGAFEMKPADAAALGQSLATDMNHQTGGAEPALNYDAVQVTADTKGVMLAVATADLDHYRKYRISTGVNTTARG